LKSSHRARNFAQGLDDIGTSMQQVAAIDTYEKSHAATAVMYDPVDVKNYS